MTAVLGIETSCDETAAAIVIDGAEVRSSVVSSQIEKHAVYGGVVPELAAREHLNAIGVVVGTALQEADMVPSDLAAVSVTNGPGLIPALLVGVNFAKGFASANDLPFIGINHFIAHIYGTFLDTGTDALGNEDLYPILSLVVSGGHTALVLIQQDGSATIVGTTLDDAAGEAFDKAAKLLNLGYPGGPVIERISRDGDSRKYNFPRSLTGQAGKALDESNRFNFSFSGVKTSLLYHCQKLGGGESIEGKVLYDTVASYQEAIVDVLTQKTKDAAAHFGARSIVLCGGVACNGVLRDRFEETFAQDYRLHISPKKYCTDNAAMVAGLAYHELKHGHTTPLDVDGYSRFSSLTEVWFTS